jgi:4'-phosphopantetheinyl transferase EntD
VVVIPISRPQSPSPRIAPCAAGPNAWRLAFAHAEAEPVGWLSVEERRIFHSLRSTTRRLDWCAGHIAAKRAVMALLPITDPAKLHIDTGERGEPVVAVFPGADIRLSLSHRDARALAVAAEPGLRVGVDLERDEAIPASRARYFLTERERRQETSLGLARLWALKEAAWKALDCDARLPFASLELCFDEGGRVIAVAIEGVEHRVQCVQGRPWVGHVLAICLVADEVRS